MNLYFIFLVLTVKCQNLIKQDLPIIGDSGQARLKVSEFGYNLLPSVCGNFNDCFNCTLSNCIWQPTTKTCRKTAHNGRVKIKDFYSRGKYCGDPLNFCKTGLSKSGETIWTFENKIEKKIKVVVP